VIPTSSSPRVRRATERSTRVRPRLGRHRLQFQRAARPARSSRRGAPPVVDATWIATLPSSTAVALPNTVYTTSVSSTTQIEAGSTLKSIGATLTGNLSECGYVSVVVLDPEGTILAQWYLFQIPSVGSSQHRLQRATSEHQTSPRAPEVWSRKQVAYGKWEQLRCHYAVAFRSIGLGHRAVDSCHSDRDDRLAAHLSRLRPRCWTRTSCSCGSYGFLRTDLYVRFVGVVTHIHFKC